MTRHRKWTRALAAMAVLALLGGACTARVSSRPGSAISAEPQDLFEAAPALSVVRGLLGDDNWWPGPPSFKVRPLDMASFPTAEQFSVTQPYVHVGTAETFAIDYSLWDTTSAAVSRFSAVETALGASATGPKVGDQTLYYGSQDSSAAPFSTATFVRVGPILATISWSRAVGFPTIAQLADIATSVTSQLNGVISGKVRGTAPPNSDATLLPPGGFDITMLGSSRISVEAAVAMIGFPIIDAPAQVLRSMGLNDVLFGDYALDADTQMEVRASVFSFPTAKDATAWFNYLQGTTAGDQGAIAGYYDSTRGQYLAFFASGTRTALLICRNVAAPVVALPPIGPTVAASRACEDPLNRVSAAWKLSIAP